MTTRKSRFTILLIGLLLGGIAAAEGFAQTTPTTPPQPPPSSPPATTPGPPTVTTVGPTTVTTVTTVTPSSEVPLMEGEVDSPPEPIAEEPPPPTPADLPAPPLTAAERFLALPRFGAAIFGQEPPALLSQPQVAETEPASAPITPASQPRIEPGPAIGEAVPPSYIVGPGDELAVRVWTDAIEHVNATPVVDAEGRVYLDLLGEVTVAGESIAELRALIARRYRVFFTRAEVSVGLTRTRVIEVRVTGEALHPGKYRLSGNATLFSALYAAGGPSEIGSLRAIKLIRRGAEPLVVDLYDYLLTGNISGDVPLQADDTVFIPPAGATVGVAGEVRRPARYELTGETTLAQALQLAAGVAATGYVHNLELWRVGESGRRELLNVDATGDCSLLLRDGDLVLVTPVLEDPENVVELSGAVLRPGRYQIRPGMRATDLLALGQGLAEEAHMGEAALWRLGPDLDYDMIRVNLAAALGGDPAQDPELQARDRLIIYAQEDVESPKEVTINGAVLRPGTIPWVRGMRVSDLVAQAGGLVDGAYTPQANLMRLGPDQRRALIPVNLEGALAGDAEADMTLERGDVLKVFLRETVSPPSEVRVYGMVNAPGSYPRPQAMRVSDAILAAGGLTRHAGDEVEYTPGGVVGSVKPLYLSLHRNGDHFVVQPDPIVSDGDLISVLGIGDLIPEPGEVSIAGHVARPGSYALQEAPEAPDTVYQLIRRAGGLLPDANPRGIVLYRLREEIIGNEQEEDLRQVIATFNREITAATVEGEERRVAGTAAPLAASLQTALTEGGNTVIIPPRRLSETAWARAVPIDGATLIATQGREGDFPLLRGDVVVIPPRPTTVTVMGAVVRAGALSWEDGQCALDYIERAGNFTPDARRPQTVVIRANGEVVPRALKAEIYAGDIILVPSDYVFRAVNRPGTLERIVSTIAGILTGYLIFD